MPASPDASPAPEQNQSDHAAVVPLADLLKDQKPVVVRDPVVREVGGRKDGPDPARYGDWEKNGRCIDF